MGRGVSTNLLYDNSQLLNAHPLSEIKTDADWERFYRSFKLYTINYPHLKQEVVKKLLENFDYQIDDNNQFSLVKNNYHSAGAVPSKGLKQIAAELSSALTRCQQRDNFTTFNGFPLTLLEAARLNPLGLCLTSSMQSLDLQVEEDQQLISKLFAIKSKHRSLPWRIAISNMLAVYYPLLKLEQLNIFYSSDERLNEKWEKVLNPSESTELINHFMRVSNFDHSQFINSARDRTIDNATKSLNLLITSAESGDNQLDSIAYIAEITGMDDQEKARFQNLRLSSAYRHEVIEIFKKRLRHQQGVKAMLRRRLLLLADSQQSNRKLFSK